MILLSAVVQQQVFSNSRSAPRLCMPSSEAERCHELFTATVAQQLTPLCFFIAKMNCVPTAHCCPVISGLQVVRPRKPACGCFAWLFVKASDGSQCKGKHAVVREESLINVHAKLLQP